MKGPRILPRPLPWYPTRWGNGVGDVRADAERRRVGPNLHSTAPRSSFTTPSTLSTTGHGCVRRRQELQESNSGPQPGTGNSFIFFE